MKFLKIFFSFLLVVLLSSCLKDTEPGLEQYYDNRDEGIAFLETNKLREGIVVTESTLQYEIVEEGVGEVSLQYDNVKIYYTVQTIDGTVVSSNKDSLIDEIEYSKVNLFLEQFIEEGLQLMNVGSIFKFYVPYQLAYGLYGNGDILPFSTIIVEIELLENFFLDNALKEGVMSTSSGLQYEIITEGTGENATEAAIVTVNYHGTFLNGEVFDSSVDRGEPLEIGVDQFIQGLTEGITLMNLGAKYKFYIPYDLGYGELGSSSIPIYSALIFEIELIEIEPNEVTN